MFSTEEHLRKRTPAGGIDREQYIEHLVEEFHTTTNVEAQEQLTANLANFAYDPINYPFFKKSSVLDIFIQILKSPNELMVLHGIAGICNLCLDNDFQNTITQPENIQLIFRLLHEKEHTGIIINTITTLYSILDSNKLIKGIICIPDNIQRLQKLRESKNIRVQKLASLFIEDYATRNEIILKGNNSKETK